MPPVSPSDRMRRHELLSCHTTFRIGGPADLFLPVSSEDALIAAVRWAIDQRLLYLIIGGGSNVLVADAGVRGIVIANRARRWKREAVNSDHAVQFRIASGVPLSQFARHTLSLGLAGLEWAVGIPGTVGGAIIGNAGAHGGCMADSLATVRVLNADGAPRDLAADDLCLGYRTSAFKSSGTDSYTQLTIVSAEFNLETGDRSEVQARAAEFLARRRETQPKGASAGSIFANPPGDSAGRLIEAAGLKGATRAAARISDLHANFILNTGGATADDVLSLMALARRTVLDRFGVILKPEITLVGDWGTTPPGIVQGASGCGSPKEKLG